MEQIYLVSSWVSSGIVKHLVNGSNRPNNSVSCDETNNLELPTNHTAKLLNMMYWLRYGIL